MLSFKNTILFLSSILFFLSCSTSHEKAKLLPNSFYEEYVQETAEDITALKKGVLLVRLNDRKKEIEYYTKTKQLDLVSKIEKEIKMDNDSMIRYFEEHYSFSKTMFYFLSDSKKVVKDKNYETVFSNDSDDIDLKNQSVYYCLIGPHPDSDKRPLEGFSIMKTTNQVNSERLHLLNAPFPSFIKAVNVKKLMSNKRNWEKAVINLNSELNNCHHNYSQRNSN